MQLLNVAVKLAHHITKMIVTFSGLRTHFTWINPLFAQCNVYVKKHLDNFNDVDLKYITGHWVNIIFAHSFPVVGLSMSYTKGKSDTMSHK